MFEQFHVVCYDRKNNLQQCSLALRSRFLRIRIPHENADAQQAAEETEATPIQKQPSDDSDADNSDADEQQSDGDAKAEPAYEPSDSSEGSDLQISEFTIKLGGLA